MSNLISCVSWVRRGVSASNPQKYQLDETELQRVSALARIELEDAKLELEKAHKAALSMGKGAEGDEGDDDAEDDEDAWVDESNDEDRMDEDERPPVSVDDLSAYKLDSYDDEDTSTALGPFSNIKGLQYYQNEDDDPYITLKEDDDAEERAELEVLPSDNLIVVAKTEDEISQLEIYVYDEGQENLYVHHDLMLPAFPLCLEWLDFPPSSSPSRQSIAFEDINAIPFGNFIAVGTMDPEIEIWSLDTVECLYPDAVLGRPDKTAAHVPTPLGTGKKKKKKLKARPTSSEHHVDAVLGLSWNKSHRNLLASASADKTVKVWDLNRELTSGGESGGAIQSFDLHKDKVQAVQWNASDPTVLLTGSYDRTVRTFDSRTPDSSVGAIIGADVEVVRWDPWESHSFFVSLENGMVLNFDARKLSTSCATPSPAKYTISAHSGAASALDVNPHIRGCIVTGGTDKMVKIWNITEQAGQRDVSLVTSRDLGVGKVFSASFSPDDPLTVAAAGSKAKLQIWDVGANAGARRVFKPKLAAAGRDLRERETNGQGGSGGVIGVASDDEESDDDDDADE